MGAMSEAHASTNVTLFPKDGAHAKLLILDQENYRRYLL